jgi:hypothetical protein
MVEKESLALRRTEGCWLIRGTWSGIQTLNKVGCMTIPWKNTGDIGKYVSLYYEYIKSL